MRKLFLVVAFIIGSFSLTMAQRTVYNGVFAPTEDWVKPAERPYRNDLCLDGQWDFAPSPLPAGFREGVDAVPVLPSVKESVWAKTPVRVPSPWNVNSFADQHGQGGDFRSYPSYPKDWENIKMGWLRKRFTVPVDWKGQRVQLHFQAVAGDALILVNGKEVGKHFGIFLPFDIDITDAIIPGAENEVCVGIRKASLFDKRGEYGRRTYQAGSFWGQHIAGIWQDVWLVALPEVHVADVYLRPQVDSGKLVAEISLTNDGKKAQTVTIDASVFPWMKNTGADPAETGNYETAGSPVLGFAPVSVTVPGRGEKKFVLTVEVNGKLKEWSPASPSLYGLVTELNKNSKPIDHKYTRFGWRQIRLEGDKILLNGQPLVMKGDSWHFLGIPQMTRRYAAAWFQAMRDANLNAVRLHAQPYPAFYLDVADEMGILVLDETAMWASDGGPRLNDPAYWTDSKTHLQDLVLRDRNHPSVFGWSVSNEIMPIVRGVMHDPPGMKDNLIKHYGIWRDICRELDPSRPWISADGEDDGEGTFPVYVVHYGGTTAMDRGLASHKPWGVGEAGNAYYGTPEQVSEANGNRAYESFLGRMEGVAASSWQTLMNERQRNAVYRSVFNMVWYGLRPLPLGLRDTTKAPTLEDGVWFSSFKEGQPGVQPERLGPYCTTLNPGYDSGLPLYQTWPLFDAIKDAGSEQPAGEEKWGAAKNVKSVGQNTTATGGTQLQNTMAVNNIRMQPVTAGSAVPVVSSALVLAGEGSMLADELKRTGVPLDKLAAGKNIPNILFIDGTFPPSSDPRPLIDKILKAGGTVMLWNPAPEKLSLLNQWLPAKLALSSRAASSLLPVQTDPLINGLDAAGLYFSELRPPEVVTHGLDGEMVRGSKILLDACNTDWQQWNKQPEYAKTAMVIRSEREVKPSGVALIEKDLNGGRWIVTTLPAAPRLTKAEKAVRTLLANLGITLGAGNDAGNPLLKGGDIARALYCGNFPISSVKDGMEQNFVDISSGDKIKAGAVVADKKWFPLEADNGAFDLSRMRKAGPVNNAVGYLSFWVFSTRSLEDLLLEPNIPIVNLEMTVDDAAQVWLNGKEILAISSPGPGKASGLKLRQGWNHFLIKTVQGGGGWSFSGRLTCNQLGFLATLGSALEKP